MTSTATSVAIRRFQDLRRTDVAFAGGKGANLGELTSAGLPVPGGFVVGAPAYAEVCDQTGLRERLEQLLDPLDVEDSEALRKASDIARDLVASTPLPEALAAAIRSAYAELADDDQDAPVAVRSSATAEDTAAASFAGMNETYLNVRGADAVIDAVRACWASLFGARTIAYRASRGLPQASIDIAVVVQRQIDSTRSGVMFTVDPSTGNSDQLVIEASFALGEAVVSGSVTPDRFVVEKETDHLLVRSVHRKEMVIEFDPAGGTRQRDLSDEEARKPTLSDAEVLEVAHAGERIEEHYGSPQDTEFAFDPEGALWMLQSRPITTLATLGIAAPEDAHATALVHGLGAAPGWATGVVRIVRDPSDAKSFPAGSILVAHRTAPDWVPIMRQSAAIVTDTGGMTCHAAIVSRELGIPAVVGAGNALSVLRDGEHVTVDATHGTVLEGERAAPGATTDGVVVAAGPASPPVTGTTLLVNLSEPSQVERAAALPVDGVGLLRAELMLLEALDGVHPRALIEAGKTEQVTEHLADALRTFSQAFAPRPITYRTIDFRTNEFRGLQGGDRFEPDEENPMIGYRGALRYTLEPDLLAIELDALTRVWDEGGTNLHVMLPFVRTAHELRRCREIVAESGLLHRRGFELWIMAEVPSVLFSLGRYAELGIAGISIGSNDLTQLMLGADRDNEVLAETFDERDPAVTEYLTALIDRAHRLGLRTSICGQAPSIHPEYADVLVRAGIDAVSVTPDAVDRTRRLLAAAEQRVLLEAARAGARPALLNGRVTPDTGVHLP